MFDQDGYSSSPIDTEKTGELISKARSLAESCRKTIERDAAIALNGGKVKAIISDHAILCGYCGHKIAGHKGLKANLGNGTIYLICRHKDRGRRCNKMNEIDL